MTRRLSGEHVEGLQPTDGADVGTGDRPAILLRDDSSEQVQIVPVLKFDYDLALVIGQKCGELRLDAPRLAVLAGCKEPEFDSRWQLEIDFAIGAGDRSRVESARRTFDVPHGSVSRGTVFQYLDPNAGKRDPVEPAYEAN